MNAVSLTTTPNFSVGDRKQLFTDQTAFVGRGQRYDVSADGQRFVVVETLEVPPNSTIHVVQNWFPEFRDREQD